MIKLFLTDTLDARKEHSCQEQLDESGWSLCPLTLGSGPGSVCAIVTGSCGKTWVFPDEDGIVAGNVVFWCELEKRARRKHIMLLLPASRCYRHLMLR